MSRLLHWTTPGLFVMALTALVNPISSEAAPPDDPVGRWRLRCVSPDGKRRECVVVIARDGNTLKGVYVADGQERSVKEVSFERGILSVRVDGQFIGQAYALTYKGAPSATSYCGTVHWAYGWASGQFDFEGERLPDNVAAVP